jgi:hypothetical protein
MSRSANAFVRACACTYRRGKRERRYPTDHESLVMAVETPVEDATTQTDRSSLT